MDKKIKIVVKNSGRQSLRKKIYLADKTEKENDPNFILSLILQPKTSIHNKRVNTDIYDIQPNK